MSEKSLLSIYLVVARLHLSPLFEENLMTLWLGANSKHRTCWNWKFLSVKIRMQSGAGAQCSANKNILNWVTGCSCQSSVAADISTKMMSSAFNICLHCSTEWVCTDLSLPPAGLNCISGVHWSCSCSAECMCIFIFIRSSSCSKAEGTLTVQSTVGI